MTVVVQRSLSRERRSRARLSACECRWQAVVGNREDCFDLLDFKRPGGDARRVVKVCSRRMRGARFLYLESSPRLWVASELVDGG